MLDGIHGLATATMSEWLGAMGPNEVVDNDDERDPLVDDVGDAQAAGGAGLDEGAPRELPGATAKGNARNRQLAAACIASGGIRDVQILSVVCKPLAKLLHRQRLMGEGGGVSLGGPAATR